MPSKNSILSRCLTAVAFIATLLPGCAEQPPLTEPSALLRQIASADAIQAFQLSGRIAVKHDGQGFSGTLRWVHDALHDEILLLSPLGQGVARIARTPSGITLTTADEKVFHADNFEALTQNALGWRLPLHGLEHWVLGLAVPEGAARLDLDANGHPSRLSQNGWLINYERYQTVQGVHLPTKLGVQRTEDRGQKTDLETEKGENLSVKLDIMRDNDFEVRLVIDRWVLE